MKDREMNVQTLILKILLNEEKNLISAAKELEARYNRFQATKDRVERLTERIVTLSRSGYEFRNKLSLVRSPPT
jgi:ubiquinone biosynthesis protein UbiJ